MEGSLISDDRWAKDGGVAGQPARPTPAGPTRLTRFARSARVAWTCAALLAVGLVVQSLRTEMAAPWELAGLSHAVGIPVGMRLTAGFAVRNRSRLPLRIVSITVRGDERGMPQDPAANRRVRLDVVEVAVLRGVPDGEAVPALPGTLLERELRGGSPKGARVSAGEAVELGVSVVGDGAGEFGLGPIEVAFQWGPWSGEQTVPLPRDYRVRVTAPDA